MAKDAFSGETKSTFISYQIDFLLNEIAFLQDKSRRAPWDFLWKNRIGAALSNYRFISFLRLQMMQLYWTVTRFLGLRRDRPSRPQLNQLTPQIDEDRRVLIDVTATYRYDVQTGIQRVVQQVAKAAIESGTALPVILESGKLYSYYLHHDLPDVIEIRKGDRLLLLDDSWSYLDEYRLFLDDVVRRGAIIIGFYYDIIPLLYPGSIQVFLRGTRARHFKNGSM
jgi:alpha-1,2-rhamnosyltransferase